MSTSRIANSPPEPSAWLGAVCAVLIFLPGWAVSTETLLSLQPVQEVLLSLGLTVGLAAWLLLPGLLRYRRLSVAESLLIAFLAMSVAALVAQSAPLAHFRTALHWAQVVLLILLLGRLANQDLRKNVIAGYNLLAVLAALCFILGIQFGASDLPFLIHRNHMALLLILPFVYSLWRLYESIEGVFEARRRYTALLWPVLSCGVLAYAIYVTESRAVWLGIAVSLGLAAALQLYRLSEETIGRLSTATVTAALLVGTVVACLTLLSPNNTETLLENATAQIFEPETSSGGRLRRWQNTLELIRAKPLFGWGTGSWNTVYESVRHAAVADPAGVNSAANSYLHLLAETGIAGFILFAGFCLLAVFWPATNRLQSALKIVLLSWLIAMTFHAITDFFLLMLGFGLVAGLCGAGAASSSATPAWLGRACVALLLVVAVVELRFALADAEHVALSAAATSSEKTGQRRLWKILDPLSSVIAWPMTRSNILARESELMASLRWARTGDRDPHLLMGNQLANANRPVAAQRWFEQQIKRAPYSLRARTRLCRFFLEQDRPKDAHMACTRALDILPTHPPALALLAELEVEIGNLDYAANLLNLAGAEYYRRMDVNDFGGLSQRTVATLYRNYQRVNDRRSELETIAPVPIEEQIRRTAEVPKLHSRLAISKCQLYFSTNINARFNIWQRDICDNSKPLRLRTNNSRSPFQLKAAPDGVYFQSDERGNARYRLYFLANHATLARQIDLPPGRLQTYEIHAATGSIAAVTQQRSGYTLWLRRSDGNGWSKLAQSVERLSDLATNIAGDRWAYVVNNRTLREWQKGANDTVELLGKGAYRIYAPAYKPGENRLLAVLQTGVQASQIVLLDASSGTAERATPERAGLNTRAPRLALDDGVILDARWTVHGHIVLRLRREESYQLYSLAPDSTELKPVGPTRGVVYPFVTNSTGDQLWFAHAGEDLPRRILSANLHDQRSELVQRFDWITPGTGAPARRSTLRSEPPAIVHEVGQTSGDDAIVWLHGGGEGVSPRWHQIMQLLALHGYSMFALNYATQWGIESGTTTAPYETTAGQVEALVTRLRQKGFKRVHLLGVSTGTKVMQTALRRNRVRIDSAIEYAPVNNPFWSKPGHLPPTLIIAGANDVEFTLHRRVREIAEHEALGSKVNLHVLPDEGHDLRRRKGISERIRLTLQHLQAVSRSGQPPKSVAIDVGHLPLRPGAISATGRGEYWYNRDIAQQLAIRLRLQGIRVVLADFALESRLMRERARQINLARPDLLISLHHDSVQEQFLEEKTHPYSLHAKGYSLFVSSRNRAAGASAAAARILDDALSDAGFLASTHHAEPVQGEHREPLEGANGSFTNNRLLLLNISKAPSVLIECAVIVHPDDERDARTAKFRRRFVDALVTGITRYFQDSHTTNHRSI